MKNVKLAVVYMVDQCIVMKIDYKSQCFFGKIKEKIIYHLKDIQPRDVRMEIAISYVHAHLLCASNHWDKPFLILWASALHQRSTACLQNLL